MCITVRSSVEPMRNQEKSMFTGILLGFLRQQRGNPIRRISFRDFWYAFQQKTLRTRAQRHRIITYHSDFHVTNTTRFGLTTRLADDILLLTNASEIRRESPNFGDSTESPAAGLYRNATLWPLYRPTWRMFHGTICHASITNYLPNLFSLSLYFYLKLIFHLQATCVFVARYVCIIIIQYFF